MRLARSILSTVVGFSPTIVMPIWMFSNSASAAIVFSHEVGDFFDAGGNLNPIYSALGGASITDSAGLMTVNMLTPGDGLSASVGDVDRICFQTTFDAQGYGIDDALQIDLIFHDPSVGPFTAFRFSMFQASPDLSLKGQVFDKNGNEIAKGVEKLEGFVLK